MLDTVNAGKAWYNRMKMPNMRLVIYSKECAMPVKEEVWHEVQAKRFFDPVTNNPAIVFTQTDVSSTIKAEARITRMR